MITVLHIAFARNLFKNIATFYKDVSLVVVNETNLRSGKGIFCLFFFFKTLFNFRKIFENVGY